MANPAEAFREWLDSLAKAWDDRLATWMTKWMDASQLRTTNRLLPMLKEHIIPAIQKKIADPATTPEIRAELELAIKSDDFYNLMWGGLLTVAGTLSALMARGQPLGRIWEYSEDRIAKSARLDPQMVINAWRRDPAKYVQVFEDLKDLGWDDTRIDTLKKITEFLPSPRDLVEWEAKEVFEPDMISKYGLADEFETLDLSLFAKVGVTEEQARNFWIAHWEHASWLQVVEMMRRGKLEEKDLWDWFRLVEIPPFWRQKLIDISWEVPTRVDVRRFWDMRTIDETRLREVYTAIGYHGKDLDDYVLWTKIYTDFPDLLARYKNGWITLDQVKSELTGMGMSAERADTMIEEKIKKAAPERVAAEKDLTKSDIINGVKKDVISREQGAELLTEIGYSNEEAIYLLDVNIPVDDVTSVKTARELSKSDILSGLKAQVITEADARNKLLELRYTAADADFLLKIYKAAVKPPEEAKLKEASKADIVTAVKKGLITQEAGYMMLLDIGFSADAAIFILSVATEASPFSPINYSEFKDLTQKYRKASGTEGKLMSDQIRKAAQEVVRLTTERDTLAKSILEEKRGLVGEAILPAEATARLTKLQASLRQAEAELARVKAEYDRLVTEFKHA
jgi:hypothetical protein